MTWVLVWMRGSRHVPVGGSLEMAPIPTGCGKIQVPSSLGRAHHHTTLFLVNHDKTHKTLEQFNGATRQQNHSSNQQENTHDEIKILPKKTIQIHCTGVCIFAWMPTQGRLPDSKLPKSSKPSRHQCHASKKEPNQKKSLHNNARAKSVDTILARIAPHVVALRFPQHGCRLQRVGHSPGPTPVAVRRQRAAPTGTYGSEGCGLERKNARQTKRITNDHYQGRKVQGHP